jgi:hypothetical protein
VLHRALPSPTPKNTPQGTSSDWKNLPGTTHTDRQTDIVALIYRIGKNIGMLHISEVNHVLVTNMDAMFVVEEKVKVSLN